MSVALVGCGAVSRLYYAPALGELQRAGMLELKAAFDPDRKAAQAVIAGFPAAVVANSFEMLRDGTCDLVVVASPNSMHASQTIDLLRAGRSVLCEKPMATSLSDARAMEEAASTSSGLLAIGMVRRFFPAAEVIRQFLSLGVLGDVKSFHYSEGSASFDWPAASVEYFQRRQTRGGVLMDIGVHVLDLVAWWLGEPDAVEYWDDAMGGIEANCRIRCSYAGGLQGEIRLSRDTSLANRCTILGAKGWLSWTANVADRIELGLNGSRFFLDGQIFRAESARVPPRQECQAYNFEQSFVSQLRNVVEALRGREELRVPASEGLASVRLLERCYRSRTLIAMGWLTEREVEHARWLQCGAT